jgi:hypothetical protein
MTRRTLHTMLVVVAALAATPARAEYSLGGGHAAPGFGARPWGMGGVVALGGDESAIYWNPGKLAVLERNRVGFSFVNIVPDADAYQSQLAYAHILKRGPENDPGLAFNKHTIGALVENLRLDLSDGQRYTENSLRIAYAYSPVYYLTLGTTFGLLFTSSDVVGFGSSGSVIDIGGRIAVMRGVTLGIVARNVLSQIKFEDDVDQRLPRSYMLGVAYTGVKDLSLEVNLERKFGNASRYVIGGEYRLFSDMLAVRAGISSLRSGVGRSMPHIGIGFSYDRVRIDYNANFDEDTAFDTTHRFGLGVGL